MSYSETLERLKKIQDAPSMELTKPTKAPSVGSVSGRQGDSRSFPGMSNDRELDAICRQVVTDYPAIDAGRLRDFLETAQDPAWCTVRVARHIARRMTEGLIR